MAFEAEGQEQSFPKKGTSLLCSSGLGLASIAVPGELYTAFSGALLSVLNQGIQRSKSLLTLEDVARSIKDFLGKTLLTVNRNGTVWLFIRADVCLLTLGEMLVGSLVCAIAVDGHHIQDHAVVDHAVDGRHGGHRIFENALPFTED